MHVISRKKLVAFCREWPDAKDQLDAWFKIAKRATWAKWADVQRGFTKASSYECCLIFNIVGGKYRLVARRSAHWKTLFIVDVMTHREYDRNLWRKFCTCH